MTDVEWQIAVVGVDREILRVRKRAWKLGGGVPLRVLSEEVREFTLGEVADALWVEEAS